MTEIILWSVFYILITYLMQIIIHEAGHLIFGLLTNYKLIMFRVFRFALVRGTNGRFSLRISRCSGSYGQCLMLPPDKEHYPYILTTMGGIILNFITAALASISIILYHPYIPFVHKLGVILFVFYGYGFAALNLLPFSGSGTMTDGMVINVLSKNHFARVCNKSQLLAARHLIYGKTYGEIPLELLSVPARADLSNPVIGYHKILESYYYMDHRDWGSAKECLDLFCPYMGLLPAWLKNTVLMEQLFISIMQRDNTIKDSSIYSSIKRYLKQSKSDYSTIRVCAAYEIYINNTDKKTLLQKTERNKENYIYQGEVKFCNSLLIEL